MAEPGPSRSRILAALDLTEDDPSPSPLSLPPQLLPRQPGEKRKRGAEYAAAVVTPLNKRQAYGPSRPTVNSLPTGLLASTQSPGAHLFFWGGRGVLIMVVTNDAHLPRCRGDRTDAHTGGALCSRNAIRHHSRYPTHLDGRSTEWRVSNRVRCRKPSDSAGFRWG
jgi:hypothetical protein